VLSRKITSFRKRSCALQDYGCWRKYVFG